MTVLARRAVVTLLLAAALAPLPALAESKAEGGEAFVKLPGVNLEFWDAAGIFHMVNIELTAVFPTQTSVNKKVSDKIAQALSAMAWEEFSQGNPAATVKAVALDVLRKEPGGENASEVLVLKLMMR